MSSADNEMRRAMLNAIDAFATSLAYGYTDSTHDEVDLIIDRLRHAHNNVEADTNNEPGLSFNEYFLATYGHEYEGA